MKRDVKLETIIEAPQEAVWKALTEAEELTKWFPPQARVTPGQGGKIWMSWGEGIEGESTIEVWDAPRRLRHTFGAVPAAVDWVLEGRGGTTVLRMVHSGFGEGADFDDEVESHERGWAIFARNLKHYLERHRGQPCVQVALVRRFDAPREEVWPRVVALVPGIERVGAGAPFTLRASTGDELKGTLEIITPARDLAFAAENLGGALFRFSLERAKTGTLLYGILLAYGMPRAEVDAIASRWRAAIATT
jgi:uncharacterized protein YndB with AHSA1/START domain